MSRPQNTPDSKLPGGPIGAAGPGEERDDRTNVRERVRRVLDEAATPISVSQLAERLHGTEDDREYAEIHDALYRRHLQRLDAAGRLVFDMEMGLVYADERSAERLRDERSP